MHRIDGPGNNAGHWTKGDPSAIPPVPATSFTEDWYEDLQESLIRVLSDAGITPIKLDFTQLANAIRILGGGDSAPGESTKNLLNNPNFWLWQRGWSAFTFGGVTAAYRADRWRAFANGPASCLRISQATEPVGTLALPRAILDGSWAPPGIPYFKWEQLINGTGVSTLEQRNDQLLNVLAGQQVTLSVYAKTASGSVSVTPEIEQNFGSGGSSAVLSAGSAWTVTNSWQRFSFTTTLGAINGKTIGTGAHLATRFKIPSGATFTLQFTLAQLELGPVATPWKHPGEVVDKLACQRHCFKTYQRATNPGSNTAAGAIHGQNSGTEASALNVRFPVEMYGAPTITFYAPDGTAARVERNGTNVTINSIVGTSTTQSGYPSTASQASDVQGRCHVLAEAEI